MASRRTPERPTTEASAPDDSTTTEPPTIEPSTLDAPAEAAPASFQPEVFEQSTDNTSTGAVEFHPEGTTTSVYHDEAFTISYAEPVPVVVTNSWRGDVTAKVIEPPTDDTPIFDATKAETGNLPDAETTGVAAETK